MKKQDDLGTFFPMTNPEKFGLAILQGLYAGIDLFFSPDFFTSHPALENCVPRWQEELKLSRSKICQKCSQNSIFDGNF